MSATKDRFDQPGYKALQELEKLLVKAARGEEYTAELAFAVNRYSDDIVPSSLKTQLQSLTTAFSSRSLSEKPTLSEVKAYGTCHSKVSAERPLPFIRYAHACTCQTPVPVLVERPYQLTLSV